MIRISSCFSCFTSSSSFIYVVFFFFFKQKTAYEMRISDWSSDVCSSDLHDQPRHRRATRVADLCVARRTDRIGAVREGRRDQGQGEAARRHLLDGAGRGASGGGLGAAGTAEGKSVASGKSVAVRVDFGGSSEVYRKTRNSSIRETK